MTEANPEDNNSEVNLDRNRLYMDCYRFLQSEKLELPTIPGKTFKPRPDDMMPANFNYGTVVVRSLVFR